jgi:hypothetical protein
MAIPAATANRQNPMMHPTRSPTDAASLMISTPSPAATTSDCGESEDGGEEIIGIGCVNSDVAPEVEHSVKLLATTNVEDSVRCSLGTHVEGFVKLSKIVYISSTIDRLFKFLDRSPISQEKSP